MRHFLALLFLGSATSQAFAQEETINGGKLSDLVRSLDPKKFPDERSHALVVIATWAKDPLPYVPQYVAALKDADQSVRLSALGGLGIIGQRFAAVAPKLLPSVVPLLDDPNEHL